MADLPFTYSPDRYYFNPQPTDLSAKEREVAITHAMVSALPKDDKWHNEPKKWEAIRRVVEDGQSYRAAAKEVGAATSTLVRWVSEFESRLLRSNIHIRIADR